MRHLPIFQPDSSSPNSQRQHDVSNPRSCSTSARPAMLAGHIECHSADIPREHHPSLTSQTLYHPRYDSRYGYELQTLASSSVHEATTLRAPYSEGHLYQSGVPPWGAIAHPRELVLSHRHRDASIGEKPGFFHGNHRPAPQHEGYVGQGFLPLNASSCAIEQQPTYVGHIKSVQDAVLLLAACDLPDGIASRRKDGSAVSQTPTTCPPPRRVTRRLLDAERGDLVASGCVFAWDEKEAGMRRWTDGRVWSASRVSGCFLTYRELEARKKANGSFQDGPSANQYKPDGLIKQSFSLTTASGRKLHVISYYTKRDVREGRLRRVSEDPRFVGEGGGEWSLHIDEKEYVIRDHSIHGEIPQGMATSQNANISTYSSPSDDERESTEKSAAIDDNLTSSTGSHKRSYDRASMKTSPISEEPPIKLARHCPRPALSRLRSSSLDTPRRSTDFMHSSSSDETPTSLNTSIPPSESDEEKQQKKHFASGQAAKARQPVSRDTRVSTSPTFPRESALRGSACEMRPSDSQESANAIGALLSLANGRHAGTNSASRSVEKLHGHQPASYSNRGMHLTGVDVNRRELAAGYATSSLAPPKRGDLDRHALNMLKVQL